MKSGVCCSTICLLYLRHKCTGECKSVNGNVRHDKSTFSGKNVPHHPTILSLDLRGQSDKPSLDHDRGEKSSLLQYQSCLILSQCIYNRRLFGVPVHQIVRSDSVWNSLVLCSNSSSKSRSSSCSNSSSKSSSSCSSSRHLAPTCSGLRCITAAARQGRADPIGSQADPPGRRGLVGY